MNPVSSFQRASDDKRVAFLTELLRGANASLAAARANLNRGSVYRWKLEDPEFAAVAQLGVQGAGLGGVAFGDLLERAVLEERADRPVHPACAGAELPGLSLEPIQLRQHFHRHGHGVFVELEEGLGIVNQYVGVQDVSLFHVLHVVRSPRAGNL